MKKLLLMTFLVLLMSNCKKEQPIVLIDTSQNPQLISISVDDNTTPIVRVK